MAGAWAVFRRGPALAAFTTGHLFDPEARLEDPCGELRRVIREGLPGAFTGLVFGLVFFVLIYATLLHAEPSGRVAMLWLVLVVISIAVGAEKIARGVSNA
jgi:hypothetical protein